MKPYIGYTDEEKEKMGLVINPKDTDKKTARRCLLYLMQNHYQGCNNEYCLNTECPLNKKWR